MGVVHKLKPEVRDFIIDQKRLKPSLSCRVVTLLIAEQLKVKVSKSSINAIFQELGMSMPVGRRAKHKKHKVETLSDRVKLALQGPVVAQQEPQLIDEEKIPQEVKRAEEDNCSAIEQINEEVQGKKEEGDKAVRETELSQEQESLLSAEEKILQEMQQQQDRLAKESIRQAEEDQRKAEKEAAAQVEAQRKTEEEANRLAIEQANQEAQLKKEEEEKWARGVDEPVFSEDDKFAPLSILPQSRLSSGLILLKAIDYLIGGSSQINAMLCKRLNRDPEQMAALTEALIFESLFEVNKDLSELWSFLGKQYTKEILQDYSEQIKQVRTIKLDILHVISNIFTETRGVKINFPDGDTVFLDGQLHTTWPTAYLPSDFSGTVYGLKNYLNRYFFEAEPLVLFTAPGYDIPSKEFFMLLSNFNSANKAPNVLTLYGNKLEDLESISLLQQKRYSVVFCLWPWQFTSHRKVKKLGEFKLYHIESVKKDLYLAEIEMDLSQPSLGRTITLKGCLAKGSLNEKTRLAILSNNLPVESLDKLAGLYLSHWPNLEESFQDFSRKIELSTYAGNVQKFASLSDSTKTSEPVEELKEIFANYIKTLDSYLRWYFLPAEYQQKDFVFTSENFYKLPAMFVADKTKASVKLQVGPDYPYFRDLEYLIHRFNERQIDLEVGQSFCLENISRI